MGIIVDTCADENIFDELKRLNIKYYRSFCIDYLYRPVNTHPDMQIHFIDELTAVVAPIAYSHYLEKLPSKIKLIKGASDPGSTYPKDAAYNVARVGNIVIGNFKYVDERIKTIYREKGFDFLDVKQGYTKCNLCILDKNSAITEDDGLFNALHQANIDVLKIKPGAVSLNGFEYGFLGGASGFISENQLAFCGKIEEHPDYKRIKNFAKERNVDIISLSSTKLTDLGSILYFSD